MLFCETDVQSQSDKTGIFLKNIFFQKALWRYSNGPHLKVLFDYGLVTSAFRDIFIV